METTIDIEQLITVIDREISGHKTAGIELFNNGEIGEAAFSAGSMTSYLIVKRMLDVYKHTGELNIVSEDVQDLISGEVVNVLASKVGN